jgi:hypothetical protein
MRRWLSLLVLMTLATGCSTLYSALPNRSAVGATSGMTVEQYAIGHLRTRAASAHCTRPAHAAAGSTATHARRCSR